MVEAYGLVITFFLQCRDSGNYSHKKMVTCHSKYKFAGLNARQDTQVVYLDDYYVQIQGEKLLKV